MPLNTEINFQQIIGKPVPMAYGECSIDPFKQLHISMNSDGTITRLMKLPTVPAIGEDNGDLGQSYVSKDMTLNQENGTWFRIYRPTEISSNDKNVVKIPVILYFHMGGFFNSHADSMLNNEPCGRFASETPCIVLSLDFRLAPEHRLPAAYNDAVELLYWLKQQTIDPNGESWLRGYADFSRCYLMGCSTGGNIAYRIALCLPDLDLDPVKIAGIILNQPAFAGEMRTNSELRCADDVWMSLSATDLVWNLALPVGANRDHEYANPMVQGAYTNNIGKLPKILIRVFEGDFLLDRQMELMFAKLKIVKFPPLLLTGANYLTWDEDMEGAGEDTRDTGWAGTRNSLALGEDTEHGNAMHHAWVATDNKVQAHHIVIDNNSAPVKFAASDFFDDTDVALDQHTE
ncbi:hypothetical protein GIB67_019030 [Kingdonia uniflora]|uniref:Alpha/beta hydrolase fold-3 domain-containing protein n=1 Tax=Kingdonia uniflora TaxID=39325 RepID=A0A7J7MZA4_9MAGN|nr:hypothetical protein GIB67_019030 [Kingdonia uniflora]